MKLDSHELKEITEAVRQAILPGLREEVRQEVVAQMARQEDYRACGGFLLAIDQVESVTGLKKSKIWQMVKKDFPQPVRLGTRTTRWKETEVREWLAKQDRRAA